MLDSLLVILLLIVVSAFFSISEISLAASRKIKLKLLADEGNINAHPHPENAGKPRHVLYRGADWPERRRHSRRYRGRCGVFSGV